MTVIRFFDKLEDKIRGKLSHYPIFYAILGGVGVVLFWRGVWHTADAVSFSLLGVDGMSTINLPSLGDGLISFALGLILLLPTGLFVSNFIGNEIIISGLRGEKKLNEKTGKELKTEAGAVADIQEKLDRISEKLDRNS